MLDLRIRNLAQHMRDHPYDEMRTEDMASSIGVSSFALIRAFGRLTGLSPLRFRSALRIARAKELLAETNTSITEISLDVGYSSFGTFVRTFTYLTGVSPKQFRLFSRCQPNILFGYPWKCDFRAKPARRNVICGHVFGAVGATAVLAAGLFKERLPAGTPLDGCFINPAEPRFSLLRPFTDRNVCLFVVAVQAVSWCDAWIGRYPAVRVARVDLGSVEKGPLSVNLRALLPTDPPILTPLPLLHLLHEST